MPCVYEHTREDNEANARARQALDERTAQLCRVFTALEAAGSAWLIPVEDREWWAAHKEFDAKRKG